MAGFLKKRKFHRNPIKSELKKLYTITNQETKNKKP